MKSLLNGLVCACIFSAVTTITNAATISYEFSATVNDPGISFFSIGEIVSGSVVVDSGTASVSSVSESTYYDMLSYQVSSPTIGVFSSNPVDNSKVSVSVKNDGISGTDTFSVIIDDLGPNFSSLIMQAFDSSKTVFSNEDLPVPFPSLSSFDALRFELDFFTNGSWGNCSFPDQCHIEATINSLTATVVPIPVAVWLFGSGLLGLIGVARRNKCS